MFLENILHASLGFVWTQTGKKKNWEKNSRLFNNACFERRQQKNSDQIFNVEQDALHSSFFSSFFFFPLKQSEAGQQNIKPHFARCFLTDLNEKINTTSGDLNQTSSTVGLGTCQCRRNCEQPFNWASLLWWKFLCLRARPEAKCCWASLCWRALAYLLYSCG